MGSPLFAGSCFSRSHRDHRGCQCRQHVANRSPWLRASVRKQASRLRLAQSPNHGEPLACRRWFLTEPQRSQGCQMPPAVANRSPWLRASVREQASRRRLGQSPNHGEPLACRQLFLTEPQRSQRVPMPPARCQPVSVAPRLGEKTSQPPSRSDLRRLRQRDAAMPPQGLWLGAFG